MKPLLLSILHVLMRFVVKIAQSHPPKEFSAEFGGSRKENTLPPNIVET
jgi:hypothetical protein